ncbi:uncharacterized protein LOC143188725 [Calliopsis andreniformis]|uniref:uncharacterized protein LOC143188725 n=1 Tax=Calliopsis andreniformis TaxID=337506 RepID=UPI003FCD589E
MYRFIDDRTHEARNAIDREATVTALDRPKVNRTSLSNFKLGTVADKSSSSVSKLPVSSAVILEKQIATFGDLRSPHLKFSGKLNVNSSTIKHVDLTDPYMRRLRQKLLTVPERSDVPTRTIMSFNPRNTKPPIREPNMPEKQQKKEDKKDKKKKKPVIHTESEGFQNDPTLMAKDNLHDNLDVNFRNQWGIRIPEVERSDFQVGQAWGQVQHLESPTAISGMNYSASRASAAYETEAIEAIKTFQLTMSATKDTEPKTEAKSEVATTDVAKQTTVAEAEVEKKTEEVQRVESLKGVLKATSNIVPDTTSVDEEYNIPHETDFDAEISAWKDLVQKSKVPVDPSREEFERESSARTVEMLSIRPEAPQPKLDVQAVPSSEDALKEEEEEQELPGEYKSPVKPMDVKNTTSEVQKVDTKKIHTGSLYSLLSKIVDKDTKIIASGYSTSSESGWGRLKETFAKATEGAKSSHLTDAIKPSRSTDHSMKSVGASEPSSGAEEQPPPPPPPLHQQQLSNVSQSQMEEDEFADSLNAIADKEMEIALSQSHQENQENFTRSGGGMSVRPELRKFEVEERRSSHSEDFHNSFDYANPSYEDDYYHGYDSMSMEPVTEKPAIERKKIPQLPGPLPREEQEYDAKQEQILAESAARSTHKLYDNYIVPDGDYVRVAGDPYPYNRDYFEKWHMPGTIYKENSSSRKILNSPDSAGDSDTQPSVRKMSHDARAYAETSQGKGVRD